MVQTLRASPVLPPPSSPAPGTSESRKAERSVWGKTGPLPAFSSVWEPSLNLKERGVSACQPGRVSGAASTEGKGLWGGRGEQWRRMGRNYLGV